MKLVSLGLAALLLAPFARMFWLMALHEPASQEEMMADLEKSFPKETSPDSADPDGISIQTVQVSRDTCVLLTRNSPWWLGFYPRRWVGVTGLIAVAFLFYAVTFSLFVPGPNRVSATITTDSIPEDPP